MSDILAEYRGHFWWADTIVPKEKFAPTEAVGGTLQIKKSGHILLNLDGHLPRKKHIKDRSNDVFDSSLMISGVLRGTAKGVLVWDLGDAGHGFSHAGSHYENYRAFRCLLGSDFRKTYFAPPKFSEIEFCLDEYSEWFSTNAIEVQRNKNDKLTSVHYQQPARKRFQLTDCEGEIFFGLDVESEGFLSPNQIKIKETVSLSYNFGEPVSSSDLITRHVATEDFLLLLTNSENGLSWPQVRIPDQSSALKIYYPKFERSQMPLRWNDCWVFYNEIEESFGLLLKGWLEKRDEYGAAYFSYAASRRGVRLYEEHKFASLVWGLESFHRFQIPKSNINKLSSKIDKLLLHIPNKRDRKWLESLLRPNRGPTLAERLKDIIDSIPINLNVGAVVKFTDRCARLRNELSHYAGSSTSGGYKDFLKSVCDVNPILDIFYHLKLLVDLGVSSEVIQNFMSDKRRSYAVNEYLRMYGLIEKRITDPEQ